MDYFLKSTDEQTLMNRLADVGIVVTYDIKDETGAVVDTRTVAAPGYTLDIIGTIYKQTGAMVTTTEGEYPEVEALEGFHANLRGPVDLSEKVEYVQPQAVGISELTPSALAELENPEVVEPIKKVTPSPIADLIVFPKNPVRVWA